MPPPRILITVDPHLPVPPRFYGGIERIAALLISELRKRGHPVGLVAHPESTEKADYFRSWPQLMPKTALAHAGNALALLRAIREYRPAVVRSFSRLAYLSPVLLQQTPKIMSYQRPVGGPKLAVAASLARSLTFTGCSAFIANSGRRCGGKWYAVPNFVDTGRYEWTSVVANDAPLVFLGRVESVKGAHIAIEVARRTGRRLLIAGTHADGGPEERYWDSRIAPELDRNGIEYVGAVDDSTKSELLSSAWALIVPIQWDEPFGIVFTEALACGTPVIACPRGAVPEIVRHGMEGFLVTDADGACEAVNAISRIDRAACRRRVEAEFSVAAVVPRYESIYALALSERAHSPGAMAK